jgi:hypothetical protein
MYFQPAGRAPAAAGGRGALAATLACAGLVVLLGILPGAAIDSATIAEQTLTSRRPLPVGQASSRLGPDQVGGL